MRRVHHFVLLCLFASCLICPVESQTTTGLIKRTPESVEELRQAERRITLDVQVRDASGKPVSGLEQQDLTLLDNDHPTTLTSFREIEASNSAAPAEAILLLDTTNASFQDVVIERQGIDSFLRQDGGRLALPVSIVFLADTGVKLGKSSQDGNSLADDLKKLPTPMPVIGSDQGPERAQDRAQRSLLALQKLAAYETTKPGRKLLIWVGPGWPLLSRSTVELSARDQTRYFEFIVEITTALRRAHTTLYSVAPLNLAQVNRQNPHLWESFLNGVENPSRADSQNLALQVLAVHSGGLVLGQSGDLTGQIGRCIADSQDYYEIGFDAATDDPAIQYHGLQVKLAGAGATARTSTAYYAGVAQSTPGLPPPVAAPLVLAAEARLVVVDVTVLDKQGLPVRGLSTYFALSEDNVPQTIVSVEEHSAADHAIAPKPTDAIPAGAISFSNKPAAGSVWNVILIDLYNTPNENRGSLQSQLEKFLEKLPEHEPVALVTMSSHLRIDTSFQDGARAAYLYLHKNGLVQVDPSIPASIVERQETPMPSADATGGAIARQSTIDVARQGDHAQTTLACFSALAHWLAPYPGRKNVYWLSGGFTLEGHPFSIVGYNVSPSNLGPDSEAANPAPMQQKTDKELENARVAIYPVDARGVAATDVDGMTTADTEFVSTGTAVRKDLDLASGRRQEMIEIAHATGGAVQFNNNIAQALSEDFLRASTYYTVAYTPPDKKWKGAYHHIQISLDKPGIQLVYRRGYYARSAENPSKPTPDQFKEALELNAPSAPAVQFTAKITKSGDMATAEYSVEPRTVDFQEDPPGQFLTDIDFAILEYDAKGKVLDKSLIRLSGKMTPAQRASLSAKALSAKQTIGLKAGATTLVLGVRDQISGKFGNVQVPLAAGVN